MCHFQDRKDTEGNYSLWSDDRMCIHQNIFRAFQTYDTSIPELSAGLKYLRIDLTTTEQAHRSDNKDSFLPVIDYLPGNPHLIYLALFLQEIALLPYKFDNFIGVLPFDSYIV